MEITWKYEMVQVDPNTSEAADAGDKAYKGQEVVSEKLDFVRIRFGKAIESKKDWKLQQKCQNGSHDSNHLKKNANR